MQKKPRIPELLEKLSGVVQEKVEDFSLFRHHQFIKYLDSWFFKGFNLSTGELDLSRHSTAHGVAPADAFTRERALLGFLILEQIFFYI